MHIFKPHVAAVTVRSTELTNFTDVHKNMLITSIELECRGELKDGTIVGFDIEATQQEREAIIHVLEEILLRFQLENGTVSEHNFVSRSEKGKAFDLHSGHTKLAGIKYDDG